LSKIRRQKPLHVSGNSGATIAHRYCPKIAAGSEAHGHAQHPHRPSPTPNSSEAPGSALDAACGVPAQMRHGFSTETNWPPKCRVWNQSEVAEVGARKQIGINLNESAQHHFRDNFSAH